jgi:hypothetical protein
LIVVILCKEYDSKEWCGLDWRAIQDLIKKRQDRSIMFVRFDDTTIPGVYSTDGYVDANTNTPDQVAEIALKRHAWAVPGAGQL